MATARTRPHQHPGPQHCKPMGVKLIWKSVKAIPTCTTTCTWPRAQVSRHAYLGAERVHDLDIRMTGEDFSYFANEVPGCFYRLGTASL